MIQEIKRGKKHAHEAVSIGDELESLSGVSAVVRMEFESFVMKLKVKIVEGRG